MWIYLSWLATLLGAVIAASLSHWGATTTPKSSSSDQLLDALRVLQIMASGFQQGKVNTFPELSQSLRLGYDALEGILDKLESADIVRKSEGNAWLLMRDVAHIRASELLRLFVLHQEQLLAGKSDDPLQRWFANSVCQLEQNADLTLRELFAYSTEYSMSISRTK